jgi:hypothetical protein
MGDQAPFGETVKAALADHHEGAVRTQRFSLGWCLGSQSAVRKGEQSGQAFLCAGKLVKQPGANQVGRVVQALLDLLVLELAILLEQAVAQPAQGHGKHKGDAQKYS